MIDGGCMVGKESKITKNILGKECKITKNILKRTR
jgi:hypothetical protein